MYRNIGRNIIIKRLKALQKTDCSAFNPAEIGKDKFFFREYFVKKGREENMNMFNYALEEPKRNLNKVEDIENYEGKINKNINYLII